METFVYYNLTNGINRIFFPEDIVNCSIHFIRIQSTWLEQKRYSEVLEQLDYDFLMKLALGNDCVVYDTSQKDHGISRACWAGVEWIRYACSRAWFDHEPSNDEIQIARTLDSGIIGLFREQYTFLSKDAKNKLKYCGHYVKLGDFARKENPKLDLRYVSEYNKSDGLECLGRFLDVKV